MFVCRTVGQKASQRIFVASWFFDCFLFGSDLRSAWKELLEIFSLSYGAAADAEDTDPLHSRWNDDLQNRKEVGMRSQTPVLPYGSRISSEH